MENKKMLPIGVRDYEGNDLTKREEIERKLLEMYNFYSYEKIDTPTFEYFSAYSDNLNAKDMYVFTNKEGELLALRNDITKSIARVVSQKNSFSFPIRYSYSNKKFSNLSSLNGDSHEYMQCGIEYIGKNGYKSDAEVIRLAILSLKTLGFKEFSLHICSNNFLNALFKDLSLTEDAILKIKDEIKNKDLLKIENLLKSLNIGSDFRNNLSQFLVAVGDIKYLQMLQHKMAGIECLKELKYLEEIYEDLGDLSRYISFDFSISTFESYYTGIYFMGYVGDSGVEVLSGGRYDNLIKNPNVNSIIPAIGFGLYVDKIIPLLAPIKDSKEVYAVYYDKYTVLVDEFIKSLFIDNKVNVKILNSKDLNSAKQELDKTYTKFIYFVNNEMKEEIIC